MKHFTVHLSPQITINLRDSSTRRTVIVLMFFALLSVFLLIFGSIRDDFFSNPSWRNVSIYQIVKMHLSARPTHVSQVYRCPNISQPGIRRSDLDIENIKFYEDTREKLKSLRQEDEWKRAFMPALERENKISLMLLYAVFQHAMDMADLGHIVMHGSAIGAWRHHGLTPWDDDMDIAVHVRDWLKTKQVLSCIDGYTLDAGSNSKWSFFKSDGSLIEGDKKRWPFLDIFLYSEDDNYVWGLNYVHLRKFVFLKEDMFPTQTVPFECFMVPVPRHLRRVLAHQYTDPESCVSQHIDHKTGKSKSVVTVPCQQIADLYTMHFTYN